VKLATRLPRLVPRALFRPTRSRDEVQDMSLGAVGEAGSGHLGRFSCDTKPVTLLKACMASPEMNRPRSSTSSEKPTRAVNMSSLDSRIARRPQYQQCQ
jgi:hypothetical protein